jgi:hypothetical protein
LTSHSHHSPTLAGYPVWTRILRCIGLLLQFGVRSLGAHYRKAIRGGIFAPRDLLHHQGATQTALLQGCATDLRTALLRMECRFDVLPGWWAADLGPCFELDSSGNLQPNRDSAACMKDIETFQTERPTATQFDLELFRSGWVAGVQYARCTTCTKDAGGRSCTPPNWDRIAERAGGEA